MFRFKLQNSANFKKKQSPEAQEGKITAGRIRGSRSIFLEFTNTTVTQSLFRFLMLRSGRATASAANSEIIFMPGYNAFLFAKGDDCKKLEKAKKSGTVCQPPAVKDVPIPPYDYGYCKEDPQPPLTSCPPKPKKSQKGPCCHKEGETKKGGCRKA